MSCKHHSDFWIGFLLLGVESQRSKLKITHEPPNANSLRMAQRLFLKINHRCQEIIFDPINNFFIIQFQLKTIFYQALINGYNIKIHFPIISQKNRRKFLWLRITTENSRFRFECANAALFVKLQSPNGEKAKSLSERRCWICLKIRVMLAAFITNGLSSIFMKNQRSQLGQ